ncbi:trehalose-phosphatase [Roseivirga sp. BDSF3-8]|uniref:trehalose-phosphatase n=1 Tax=Roseivirga sp. BDSF3-8 TaxID=3241598 RepID=UPI003531E171
MEKPYPPLKELPDALALLDERFNLKPDNLPVLFLDFDGTLAPIENDPEKASLPAEVKDTLVKIKQAGLHVAVVSGRDRADVARKVGLPDLYYAGSHGFDISGPGGFHDHLDAAVEMLPELDEAEASLKKQLSGVKGALVERKRFAIAIHYRNVADTEVDKVREAVEAEKQQHSRLKMLGGKKIYELKPDVKWDKGQAVLWLLKRFEVDKESTPVFYLGDDLTDEDAFRVLGGKGLGIIVGPDGRETEADYALEDIPAVHLWLKKLLEKLP